MRRDTFPRLVLLLVLILASVTAAFYTWRSRDAMEGFQDDEAIAVLADGGSDYAKRMYVMKLFDALLKRKATPRELEKFAAMKDDTQILNAVIETHRSSDDPPAQDPVDADATDPPTHDSVASADTPAYPTATADADADASATTPANTREELLQHLQDITDRVARSQALVKTSLL